MLADRITRAGLCSLFSNDPTKKKRWQHEEATGSERLWGRWWSLIQGHFNINLPTYCRLWSQCQAICESISSRSSRSIHRFHLRFPHGVQLRQTSETPGQHQALMTVLNADDQLYIYNSFLRLASLKFPQRDTKRRSTNKYKDLGAVVQKATRRNLIPVLVLRSFMQDCWMYSPVCMLIWLNFSHWSFSVVSQYNQSI